MVNACMNCGEQLTFWQNLFPSHPPLCKNCRQARDSKVRQYIDKLKSLASDSYLSEEEENELAHLQKTLGLSNQDLQEALPLLSSYRELTKHADIAKYKAKLAEVGADKYLTSVEEKELDNLRNQLMLTEDDLKPTYGQLVRLKQLTSIQEGNLPLFVVSLNLEKGELCHFANSCTLVEEHTRTQHVGGGGGVSVRIMKDFSYRVGAYKGEAISSAYNTVIDRGTFYITNKRLIFVGKRKNVTYPIDKVVDYTRYADAIQFSNEKESSPKTFVFSIPEAIDEIGMIISKIISQNH